MSFALLENVPLAPLTTLGIGGAARYFVEAREENTVIEAVLFAQGKNLPFFILGGGSNIVVSDAGFPGVVVHLLIPGRELLSSEGSRSPEKIYRVGAGVEWDQFVGFCVGQNLAGVECLSGIPGYVGGTPIQNVGAYGQEASSVIRSVRAYDRLEGRIRELDHTSCGFSYRQSIFNTTERGRYIIFAVTYALHAGGAPTVRYADLERYFRDAALRPSLLDVREAVKSIRRKKAMLLIPNDPDCRSVGSFFKNPVVTAQSFEEIQDLNPGVEIPHYPVSDSRPPDGIRPDAVKLAAAWLIEQAGFSKGFPAESQKGSRVGLSSKHTLAVINRGGASAKEILEFMREIQSRVHEKFKVRLEIEPELVGMENGA